MNLTPPDLNPCVVCGAYHGGLPLQEYTTYLDAMVQTSAFAGCCSQVRRHAIDELAELRARCEVAEQERDASERARSETIAMCAQLKTERDHVAKLMREAVERRDALAAENERLREAVSIAAENLDEAASEIKYWGSYAGTYLQQKWGYDQAIQTVKEQAESARRALENRDG